MIVDMMAMKAMDPTTAPTMIATVSLKSRNKDNDNNKLNNNFCNFPPKTILALLGILTVKNTGGWEGVRANLHGKLFA